MEFKFEEEDIRGKRYFFEKGNKLLSLFEIKKNRARGGQFHNYQVMHFLISGKVEYTKENVNTKYKERKIYDSPNIISLPPNHSNLIIAIEDSILLGIYQNEKDPKFYQKHRDVLMKMNK